mgnify:CR=1 FL=1
MCIRDRCDLWGVIHNGVEVFSDAKSYLEAMKENNIDVYLISNAPRPEAVVRNGLINKLNLNPELFKKIYTSGDTGTQYINSKVHGQSYYHLGPEKDYDLLENINIQKTNDIESSEFVVCTGLYNDNDERPEDYKNIFEDFTFSNDLNAKIAIGSSVQPKIIFLHFILIKESIAGLIAFAAAFTFPILTNLIALS